MLSKLEWEIKRLDALYDTVIDELDPDLAQRVLKLLEAMNGRLTPYCGFRNAEDQAKAKKSGASNADFGESPHNYRPALACDLVLNPAVVDCGPVPSDPEYPWLWNNTSKECITVWADLEVAAKQFNLERVNLRPGVRDQPHVQMPSWRELIVGKKPG